LPGQNLNRMQAILSIVQKAIFCYNENNKLINKFQAMKIYAVVVTIIAILAGVAAGYLFWQTTTIQAGLNQAQEQQRQANDELTQVKTELSQTKDELNNAQKLVDTGFTGAKENSDILKNSLETFLVAGDLKIFTISETEARAITEKIQNISDKMDKVSLEKPWSDFLKSQKITDYFAFARAAASNINGKLENIH